LVNEACPLFVARALCRAGPLPSHNDPQGKTHSTLAAFRDKSTRRCDGVVESDDRYASAESVSVQQGAKLTNGYNYGYFIRRSYKPIN
jgi:hypothetical protein